MGTVSIASEISMGIVSMVSEIYLWGIVYMADEISMGYYIHGQRDIYMEDCIQVHTMCIRDKGDSSISKSSASMTLNINILRVILYELCSEICRIKY